MTATRHQTDVPQTLREITRRLDDTQDLLEAAAQHLTTLEDRLRRHDYAINDLHWDATRILTRELGTVRIGDSAVGPAPEPDPGEVEEARNVPGWGLGVWDAKRLTSAEELDSAAGRKAMRAVRDGSDQVVQDLRGSAAAATTGHTLLTGAGWQLRHAQRQIGDLDQLPGSDRLAREGLAVDVAVLAGRTERLATLVEAALPLADRARQQLGQAQEILQRQVSAGAAPEADRFKQFWAVDAGILDGSRAVTQARTTTRDGGELLERAVHTGTLTAVQARGVLRQHTPPTHRQPPPNVGPAAPAGPSI